ncbi:ring finger protein [Gigaspora margarita]|uniref:Ring finger protein n=1 Tax=Gigaspora margarita TaxID=4874 RepID=A0A8H3X849_GIGMA|nr:ring finger protein [Gigaspora margarita]
MEDEDVKKFVSNETFKKYINENYCNICLDEESKDFVKLTSKCKHSNSICRGCAVAYIDTSLKNGTSDIKCVASECKFTMDYGDIKTLTSEETFKRYDTLCFQHLANDIPGCGAGQIHTAKGKNPQITCVKCQQTFCYIHKTP